MPELPEVETVARGLRHMIGGQTIATVTLHRTDLLRSDPGFFVSELPGCTVAGVRRRGKYLLIDLMAPGPSREALTWLVHLGMTGQLLTLPPEAPRQPHTHLQIDFDGGELQLRYRDPRRFGFWALIPTALVEQEPPLAHLGPEPLEISLQDFQAAMGRRRGQLKALLLNQGVIAGVGNIYADEALFAARLHPKQRVETLRPVHCQQLCEALQRVLRAALEAQGSSIDASYVSVEGCPGRYQDQHQVYGRTGQPCRRCGTPIQRTVVASRSTHFCPRCQRWKGGPPAVVAL